MPGKQLKKKISQTILEHVAHFLHDHYRAVLFVFLLLTGLFGFFVTKLEQQTSVRDLLPEDNLVVSRFEDTVENFDLIDRVVVVLQFEPGQLDAAQAFAEILVETVEDHEDQEKYLQWMKANLFDSAGQLEWHRYLRYISRLIPEDSVSPLRERLSSEGIRQRVADNKRELESGLASKTLIEKDPLGLMEFAAAYSGEVTGSYQIQFRDGYLISKDASMLLVFGKPMASPENVTYSTELTAFLEARIEDAKKIFAEEEEESPDALFEVGLTGPHPITAHEHEVIQGDVVDMFVGSFAVVLLLFVLAYRRPLAVIYVGIPLLASEIWTLGIGYLLFGRLNLLTATFSAVIVGLGIDYAIHIFSRYLDERYHGLPPREAMTKALAETGLGTLVGGLTTALAFLAMSVSDFSGLREFGIIAALGILVCLFQMFVLLPCMLYMRESWRVSDGKVKAQWDFHVERLLAVCLRHRKPTLFILLAGTAFFGYHAVNLRFNTDIRSVRAKSNPSITLQNKVTAKLGGSLRSLSFVLAADSEAGLYEMYAEMQPVLQRMKADGELVRYDSLLAVVADPEAQARNMATLHTEEMRPERIESDFLTALEAENFRISDENRDYIKNLAAGLGSNEPVRLQSILEDGNPFVRPFLHFSEGSYRTLIHVYPSKGLWEKSATTEVTERILAAVDTREGQTIFVTGIQTISDELKALVRDSFKSSTLISVLMVLGMMYFHFRRWTLVALTFIPLFTSVMWMLGTMHLLGIDITILNFVATPLIIGIGIDDGVHIVEKYLHRRGKNLVPLIASCGKAVTLTSLTTIFGFSSLFLAEYSGFQSLGLCSILGVFFCWLGSVVLLPLLMDYFNLGFIRINEDGEEGSGTESDPA